MTHGIQRSAASSMHTLMTEMHARAPAAPRENGAPAPDLVAPPPAPIAAAAPPPWSPDSCILMMSLRA
jgi:hypothetical protein